MWEPSDTFKFLRRTDLLNLLISANLYDAYLEVGYGTGINFHLVESRTKLGIDIAVPTYDPFCLRTSLSGLFERIEVADPKIDFDLIFIDGSHLVEDVVDDINTALLLLREGGTIVLHDCLPPTIDWQLRVQSPNVPGWMGDVWRAAGGALSNPGLNGFTVDDDCGMTVLWPSNTQPVGQPLINKLEPLTISYYDWFSAKSSLMKIVSPELITCNYLRSTIQNSKTNNNVDHDFNKLTTSF